MPLESMHGAPTVYANRIDGHLGSMRNVLNVWSQRMTSLEMILDLSFHVMFAIKAGYADFPNTSPDFWWLRKHHLVLKQCNAFSNECFVFEFRMDHAYSCALVVAVPRD